MPVRRTVRGVLFLSVVLLLVGIVLLGRSADVFVDAAARVAAQYRLAPVLVGAVIIGFGTSLPEALASILAVLDGELDVAVGNVVGSNVANLTLVLGPAALLCAMVFPAPILRKELTLMLVSSLLLAGLLLDAHLSRFDGLTLVLGMVIALWVIVGFPGSVEASDEVTGTDSVSARPAAVWVRLVLGLVGTVGGAYLLVRAALGIADRFGLTGGLVGVSLVAIGTSLPEMVTAYHAARRGEGELIVGNLLGSNVFNTLLVAGAAGLLGPGRVAAPLAGTATWLMVAVSLLVGLLAWSFRRVPRLAVPLLLGGYVFVLLATA